MATRWKGQLTAIGRKATMQNEQQEAVDRAVHAAYLAEGYVRPNGTKNHPEIAGRIAKVYFEREVGGLDERAAKAISSGSMVADLFPSQSGPEAWDSQPDPALAEAVWKRIDSNLWQARVKVQQSLPDGYVLCDTRTGVDNARASYITRDLDCIRRDYEQPALKKFEDAVSTLTGNLVMLTWRHPDKRWLASLDTTTKRAITAAHDLLKEVLEAATPVAPIDNGDQG